MEALSPSLHHFHVLSVLHLRLHDVNGPLIGSRRRGSFPSRVVLWMCYHGARVHVFPTHGIASYQRMYITVQMQSHGTSRGVNSQPQRISGLKDSAAYLCNLGSLTLMHTPKACVHTSS